MSQELPYKASSPLVLGPGLPNGSVFVEPGQPNPEALAHWMNIAFAQGLSAREEQLREAVEMLDRFHGYLLMLPPSIIRDWLGTDYDSMKKDLSSVSALLARVKGVQG